MDSVKVQWPDAAAHYTVINNPGINLYPDRRPVTDGVVLDIKAPVSRENLLKVYPNPTKDFVLLQLEDNSPLASTNIYDGLGRVVLTQTSYNNTAASQYCSLKSANAWKLPVKSYRL